MNWKTLLATIRDDPKKFWENGGWNFLNTEDSESEEEEDEEASDDYRPDEEATDEEEEEEEDDYVRYPSIL